MNYYLSLGSNVGDKLDFLHQANNLLETCGSVTVKSAVYKSEPYGNENQDFFLNAVVIYTSKESPGQLLKKIKSTYDNLQTGLCPNNDLFTNFFLKSFSEFRLNNKIQKIDEIAIYTAAVHL